MNYDQFLDHAKKTSARMTDKTANRVWQSIIQDIDAKQPRKLNEGLLSLFRFKYMSLTLSPILLALVIILLVHKQNTVDWTVFLDSTEYVYNDYHYLNDEWRNYDN